MYDGELGRGRVGVEVIKPWVYINLTNSMLFFCHFFPDLTDVYFYPVLQYTNLYIASVERYRLNYYDAQRFCELHGATLATHAQLLQAWNNGFEHCA